MKDGKKKKSDENFKHDKLAKKKSIDEKQKKKLNGKLIPMKVLNPLDPTQSNSMKVLNP